MECRDVARIGLELVTRVGFLRTFRKELERAEEDMNTFRNLAYKASGEQEIALHLEGLKRGCREMEDGLITILDHIAQLKKQTVPRGLGED